MHTTSFCTALLFFSILINAGWSAPPKHHSSFRVLVVASRAKDHMVMMHSAKPFFEKMAADDHFSLDFTDDTSTINDANLSHYAVFIMLQLAPFDMSAGQQEAMQKYIENGGGWIGIHAAGLTGRQFLGPSPDKKYWQWFEDFMGGVTYSPHPKFQQATVNIEDHNHPATKGLPAKFQISDEWYEFNKSPRGSVRVLATVDESSYKQNKPMGDHPIIWANEKYPRTIYISIGHDSSDFSNSTYVSLLHNAIFNAANRN